MCLNFRTSVNAFAVLSLVFLCGCSARIAGYDGVRVLQEQHRYDEAVTKLQSILAREVKQYGAETKRHAWSLHNLAHGQYLAGDYEQAIKNYKYSLRIKEELYSDEYKSISRGYSNLAIVYSKIGDSVSSIEADKMSIHYLEQQLVPYGPDLASRYASIAGSYKDIEEYEEAERYYFKAQKLVEDSYGITPSQRKEIADLEQRIANGLGNVYGEQGMRAASEKMYRSAFNVSLSDRKVLADRNYQYFLNWALREENAGNYGAAQNLIDDAEALMQEQFAKDDVIWANLFKRKASLYSAQRNYASAQKWYKRTVEVLVAAFGENHPDVLTSRRKLANVLEYQERYVASNKIYEDLISTELRVWRNRPRMRVYTLSEYGSSLVWQEKYDRASEVLAKANEISRKYFEETSSTRLRVLSRLSLLKMQQNQFSEAFRESTELVEALKSTLTPERGIDLRDLEEKENIIESIGNKRRYLGRHVKAAYEAMKQEPKGTPTYVGSGFDAVQLLGLNHTGLSVARMVARISELDDDYARLARDQQNIRALLEVESDAYSEAVASPKRDADEIKNLSDKISKLEESKLNIDVRIEARFPEYAALTRPAVLSVGEVQRSLSHNEALLVFTRDSWGDDYIWLIKDDAAKAYKAQVRGEKISELVSRLRAGVDLSGSAHSFDFPDYDVEAAYELYYAFFPPALQFELKDVSSLIVVANGPLESFPLEALLTVKPVSTKSDEIDYRLLEWFQKQHTFSYLPDVVSLVALRKLAKIEVKSKNFLGVGDPLLAGHPGAVRGLRVDSLFTQRGLANVDKIRATLPSLPETADELQAIGEAVSRDRADFFLREQATELALKKADLSSYSTIAFATHGLVAGELRGLAEPALVLTPPAEASDVDDGLLTAKEVSELNIDADWVILSACNTASSDGSEGAEGLSGLAKAFFYAGARSLLVSHWPVISEAASQITTKTALAISSGSAVGKSSALKQAKLDLISDVNSPDYYAHPVFWAPFVVVGEGGAFFVSN